MNDQIITIRRVDLAPAAARIATILDHPVAGVEHALWQWARQGAALLTQDAYVLALAPESSGGFGGAIFRGALALWLQEQHIVTGRSLVNYPQDTDGSILIDDDILPS